MLLLKMTWRSIWKNPLRMGLTLAALGITVALLLFSVALGKGTQEYMFYRVTGIWMGDAQLHKKDYLQNQDENLFIDDAVLYKSHSAFKDMEHSKRVFFPGLLSIADRSRGIKVIGVSAEHEKNVVSWQEYFVEGDIFVNDKDIVIGYKLAEKIDVTVGTRLVLQFSDILGDVQSHLVRVSGIIKTANPALDLHSVLMRLPVLQKWGKIDKSYHEVIFKLPQELRVGEQAEAFKSSVSLDDTEFHFWYDLNQSLKKMMETQTLIIFVFVFIIYFIVSMGTFNTIAMSFLERVKEFGVLKAIGTKPKSLLTMFILESTWISGMSCAIGLFIYFLVNFTLLKDGLVFGDAEMSGIAFSQPVYPQLSLSQGGLVLALAVIMTMMTGALVSLKAIKLKTLEAIHYRG